MIQPECITQECHYSSFVVNVATEVYLQAFYMLPTVFYVYLKYFSRCETNKIVYSPGCGAFDSVPVSLVSRSLAHCFLSTSLFTCASRYQSSPFYW